VIRLDERTWFILWAADLQPNLFHLLTNVFFFLHNSSFFSIEIQLPGHESTSSSAISQLESGCTHLRVWYYACDSLSDGPNASHHVPSTNCDSIENLSCKVHSFFWNDEVSINIHNIEIWTRGCIIQILLANNETDSVPIERYHIVIGYVFVFLLFITIVVFLMFFGRLCASGDENFCKNVSTTLHPFWIYISILIASAW